MDTRKVSNTARTPGSLAAQNPIQQIQTGSPAAQPSSSGNTLVGSSEARRPTDSSNGLPTTPGNQSKRKFSFKAKSPRGGLSIPPTTAEAGPISTNKRVKWDDKTVASFNNSNLPDTSDRLEALQDKSKNVQPPATASVGNLRQPSNHTTATPNIRQPLSNLTSKDETQAQTKNKNSQVPQFTLGGPDQNLGNKVQVSQRIQNPTTSKPNHALRMPGKQFSGVANKVSDVLPPVVDENFEEQLNLWEEDFNWDPVIVPPSTNEITIAPQLGSNLRSINHATSGSTPGHAGTKVATQSHLLNPQTTSVEQGGASRFNSAFTGPSLGQTTNASNFTHRFSLPHSGQSLSSTEMNQPHRQGQVNSARMNFQPSPSNPIQGPSTPCVPRTNTPPKSWYSGLHIPCAQFPWEGHPARYFIHTANSKYQISKFKHFHPSAVLHSCPALPQLCQPVWIRHKPE